MISRNISRLIQNIASMGFQNIAPIGLESVPGPICDHLSDQWLYRPNSASCLDDDHSDHVADGDGQTVATMCHPLLARRVSKKTELGQARSGGQGHSIRGLVSQDGLETGQTGS